MYALIAFAAVAATMVVFFVASAKAHSVGKTLRRVTVPMIAMFLITLIGDNVMIGSGLFSYAPESLIGIHVGLMPIEDFSYPVIAVLLASIIGGPVERK